MKISKDELWKGIIEELPEHFLQFYFAQYTDAIDFTKPIIFLDAELANISKGIVKGRRIADKLLKVHMKDGLDQWFLVHVEVQSYHDQDLPMRMFTMYYRILDKYRKDVISIAIKAYKGQKVINIYSKKFMGGGVSYKYKVFDIMSMYNSNNYDMRNVFSFILLATYFDIVHKDDEKARFEHKFLLIKQLLSEKSMNSQKIREILNFIKLYLSLNNELYEKQLTNYIIDKTKSKRSMGLNELFDMHLKKEVSKVEKKSLKKGLEQGLEKGLEQGLEKGNEIVICNGFKNNISIEMLANITNTDIKFVKSILIKNKLI